MGDHGRNLAKSLGRALDILESFSGAEAEIGVTQLSARLGLAKSTVHRLLTTLLERGYIQKNLRTNQYRLGIKTWELGCLAVSQLGLREVARPLMEELAHKTREIVHLSIRDGAEVVYIDKIESPQPIQAYSRIGSRMPAYCVATGKAILAHLPESALKRVFGRRLKAHTPRTLATWGALRKDLERVRTQGYSVNRGEWRENVCGLAAPIFNHAGEVVAAMGITVPAVRFTQEFLEWAIPLVKETTRQASRQLGCPQNRLPA
ncbi:MAG: IclR family transcriptional regulator [Candidatus Methylomirabilales bacterium]